VEQSAQEQDDRQLVRCLDCKTVYPLPIGQQEADACPECGGLGWVAIAATRRALDERSS
jgi:rRNA maturation endonuclease Nob1